jgi:hypothetical protein
MFLLFVSDDLLNSGFIKLTDALLEGIKRLNFERRKNA